MRNFILLLSFLIYTGSVSGAEKTKVLGTATMFADIANAIAGDYIDASSIVPIGADPHGYEPTPNDVDKVINARLVLVNGLTFEGWLGKLVENSSEKEKVVLITRGVNPVQSLIYENATDPHAWMDPINGKIYVKNISLALMKALPEQAKEIEKNTVEYLRKLDDIHQYAMEQLKKIPQRSRVLITSHDAFQYFGRRYDIRLESVLGISADADIRTEDIINLNKTIGETGVQAIFIESTINPKVMRQIASDNNISIGGELFADSLGEPGSSADTYLKMLRHNIDTFVEGVLGDNDMEVHNRGLTDKDSYVYVFLGLMMLGFFAYTYFKFNGNL